MAHNLSERDSENPNWGQILLGTQISLDAEKPGGTEVSVVPKHNLVCIGPTPGTSDQEVKNAIVAAPERAIERNASQKNS